MKEQVREYEVFEWEKEDKGVEVVKEMKSVEMRIVL